MSISLQIKGMGRLMRKLNAIAKDKVIRQSLFEGAIELTKWSKEKRLTGPRPKYLGVVTGRLRSSVAATRALRRGNKYYSAIGTNVKYAPVHELGGAKKNIPARPFLKPAITNKKNRDLILKIFRDNIKREVDRTR